MRRLKTNLKLLNNWKWILSGLLLTAVLVFPGCGGDDEDDEPKVQVKKTSIVPRSTQGRRNNVQGCTEIRTRTVQISVWDEGRIDGDIISLYANGRKIISSHKLNGPSRKKTVSYKFTNNGYNSLVLYAHNQGSIPPNTAAISINGNKIRLSSTLNFNGAYDIIVLGSAWKTVRCRGTNNGGGGGGGGTSTGKVIFWTDKNCSGGITVNVSGRGSKRFTNYQQSIPSCGSSGFANWTLPPGRYSYTASGGCGVKWSHTYFTITKGRCHTWHLQF